MKKEIHSSQIKRFNRENKRITIITTLTFAIISWGILGINKAQAADYYVSPTGNANWSECLNVDTPCSAEDSMQNAQAGDTVYFRGGTYDLSYDLINHDASYYWYRAALNPSHSGTSEFPIVFLAYPDELPILDVSVPSNYDNARAFGNGDQNHIIWDGMKCVANHGEKMGGAIVTGKNIGVVVVGNIIRNCIFDGGDTIVDSTDNREGIRIEETLGTLISNNLLYDYRQVDNWHNTGAIKMYHNENTTIESCEIFNTSLAIFDKSDSINSVFRYNYIHNSEKGIYFTGYAWPGFLSNHRDVKIYHNVIAQAGGIGDTEEEWADSDNMEIYNNTIYAESPNYTGIGLGPRRKKFYNNIIFGPRRDSDLGILKFISGKLEDGTRYDLEIVESDHNQFGGISDNFCVRTVKPDQNGDLTYNTYWNLIDWQSSGELQDGSNPGIGSLDSNPGFINSSSSMNELDDFRLSSSSLCKGAGRNGVDMGANIDLVGIQNSTSDIRADVDQIGGITTTDAQLTLRNSLGLPMSGTDWQESDITGDVNCDGNSNSIDAMLILRYSLGLSMAGTNWCEN